MLTHLMHILMYTHTHAKLGNSTRASTFAPSHMHSSHTQHTYASTHTMHTCKYTHLQTPSTQAAMHALARALSTL